jgi:hypothetical protein
MNGESFWYPHPHIKMHFMNIKTKKKFYGFFEIVSGRRNVLIFSLIQGKKTPLLQKSRMSYFEKFI